jgi:acyl-CoA dehydrogenase
MSFSPPVDDIMLALRSAGRFAGTPNLATEDAEAIVREAGRFAADEIAPLNRTGDISGSSYANGVVTTPPGWRDAYRRWCDSGWSSVGGSENYGGQDLPMVMSVACTELWNAANVSFAVSLLLTTGAIEAITAHASDELKQRYLPNMIQGIWTGTMNLTEPQSGSDLSGLRCQATRSSDGTYRISGTKIYITYGEHDCSDNIIHLVLARLTDAPQGTRGISLFLVPKILPDGTRNDLRCSAIEHKLGLKGSPTCTMIYGDHGGATGWLIGEENRGLNCMFTMMNNARLLVGVQGVGVAERATQMAHAYASERKQGRAPGVEKGQSAIIEHPDVSRMLLEMRAKTKASRLLCMATAAAIDESRHAANETDCAAAHARASLLTPLAKGFSTDIAVEVASLGIQVHGGMGYIEEAGAAQVLRDARILPIYEGTNGIQAIDLVTRKLGLDDGKALSALFEYCLQIARGPAQTGTLAKAIDLSQVHIGEVRKLGARIQKMNAVDALGRATPFLRALSGAIASSLLCQAASETPDASVADEALYFSAACVSGDVMACKTYCELIQN